MVEYFRTLVRYNAWARDRFLRVVRDMSEGDFVRDLGDGVGSLRDKLAHILAAESIWLDRLDGVSAAKFPDVAEFPDKAALVERWTQIGARIEKLAAALTDEALHGKCSYRNLQGKEFTSELWEILAHMMNHGTYHRGQAASLCRRITGKPPVTDFIAFVREPSPS